MAAIAASDEPLSGDWLDAPNGWMEPLRPRTGNSSWFEMPSLADLFPWQQPGCKFGRTWPIAPSQKRSKGDGIALWKHLPKRNLIFS